MRLVTFIPKGGNPRLGAVKGTWKRWDYIVDLNTVSGGLLPFDMISFVELCGTLKGEKWEKAKKIVENTPSGYRPSDVRICPPIVPRLLRDTIAFRGHIYRVRIARGVQVPQQWDNLPAYYNGNHLNVIGTEEDVPLRTYMVHEDGQRLKTTARLDYEAELAFVLGKGGTNIPKDRAKECLFGITIFNDFSMRDLQLAAMEVRLGPAPGKDWVNALGPCIVTADEFGDFDGKRIIVRVNGKERMNGTYHELVYRNPYVKSGERAAWTFEEMVEFISHCQNIHVGEVWGSGTIPGGCELEKGEDAQYLRRGDTVEIEVEDIGVLRNKVT